MPGRNIKQIRPGLVGPTTHKRVLASSTVFTMVHNQRDRTQSTPHHVLPLRTPANPVLAIILQQLQGPNSNFYITSALLAEF